MQLFHVSCDVTEPFTHLNRQQQTNVEGDDSPRPHNLSNHTSANELTTTTEESRVSIPEGRIFVFFPDPPKLRNEQN